MEFDFEVTLSNPSVTVEVTLDNENPTEFELLQAAIEVIDNYAKLDSYSQISP